MTPETKKRISELNEQIKQADTMIAYFKDRIKRYNDEKQNLLSELATMKDDFWEDDV